MEMSTFLGTGLRAASATLFKRTWPTFCVCLKILWASGSKGNGLIYLVEETSAALYSGSSMGVTNQ